MLAVQLTLTAILSPTLTAVALAVLVLGGLLSVRWARRGVMSGIAISATAEDSTNSGFRLHAGLKAALAQGTVAPFLEEYRRTLDAAAAQIVRFTRDYSGSQQLAALGAAITAAVLLFVGVRMLALPFPVLIASLVLFARMSAPAQQLQLAAQNIAALSPSFAAIENRLGRLEPPEAAEIAPRPLDWKVLELADARFAHQPELGLHGASLVLERGQWVGVAGASGAGKTTLSDLVAGLLAPQEGSVAVDGEALEGETLDRWRAGLAYVGQEGSVFNDSVRGNLLAEGATRRRASAVGRARAGRAHRPHRRLAARVSTKASGSRQPAVGRRAPAPGDRPRPAAQAEPGDPRRSDRGARCGQARRRCSRSCAGSNRGPRP